MAHELLMPQLGLTMEEGTVAKWLKQEGDPVSAGEAVVEITTDKLTNEVISEYGGILLKITAKEGDDVPVKGLLGYVGEKGEAVSGSTETGQSFQDKTSVVCGKTAAPSVQPAVSMSSENDARLRISPLARKTAEKYNVDCTGIIGSGSAGRIVQADVLKAAEQKKYVQVSAAAPAPEEEKDEIQPLTGMRKVIAQRMSQSHTEIPPVTQNTRVDVTELMKLRKYILESTGKKYSVNDFVLKAVAEVLKDHGEVLTSYDEGKIIQHKSVNIGMAVALDAGLIVPVIKNADKLSLDKLSEAAKTLAKNAKNNSLSPDDCIGSTFTVSNLGMFGIETFTPIVNQPNAGILGVCAIQDELVMEDDGTITKHQFMRLSFTYDHRLIDGAGAAKFVMAIRDMLQAPIGMLI